MSDAGRQNTTDSNNVNQPKQCQSRCCGLDWTHVQGSSERPTPVCDASASASDMDMHLALVPKSTNHLQIHLQTNGITSSPRTQHIRGGLAHLTDVPGGGTGAGDPTAWRHPSAEGPRQHRGVRGRLQTALETNSAPSAYAACNHVGIVAGLPVRLIVES